MWLDNRIAAEDLEQIASAEFIPWEQLKNGTILVTGATGLIGYTLVSALLYADKVNYTEEIVRLRSHFQQFQTMLSEADEPIGRKLDFLVQEMNREINTIGPWAL